MKVIVTVGTSLFENYKEKNTEIGKELKNKSYYKDKNRYESRFKNIINNLEEFIKEEENKSCAEINSINKLKEKYPQEEFEIFLIASDTIRSYLVAEVLKKYFENVKFKENEKHIIKNLSVLQNDRDLVKIGYKNLIKTLLNETSGYNEIYNISGGYKAVIPLITQIASYKKVNISYIYEDSDYLIEIPPFPFEIDKNLLEYLKPFFDELIENSFINKNSFENILKTIPQEFQKSLEYLFEEIDGEIITSNIGDILLTEYEEVQIIECEEKDTNVDGGRHHDKEKVEAFGKKLIQNPYVCKILGSAEYEIRKKDFILEIEPQNQTGVIKIKIPNEEKATILVQTSGRSYKETAKIAEILKQNYNKG